ncbi:uncharacterized protein LOC133202039 [Saccostrea echinata]|uniref:uncharacterized protein LOC133202039 n=1 Tax=Saccostrea echinata TaxID=191078 RepID=UPI002A80258C|nr:uncharacterized protein LOC133202039 [Saccostrea echinata]
MARILMLLVSLSLSGFALSQEPDSNSTTVDPPIQSEVPRDHADVQILYTDELMKVIEKYGLTDDDIMHVTNKFKEGNPPTVKKLIKNQETGDEEMVEVNLKNFIAGGHVTDLTPILSPTEAPSEEPSSIDNTLPPVTNLTQPIPEPEVMMPTREEILAGLRKREQDLLVRLEENRKDYEQIAQELMEVRKEIVMNTPDEYDLLAGDVVTGPDVPPPVILSQPPEVPPSSFRQTPPEITPRPFRQTPPEISPDDEQILNEQIARENLRAQRLAILRRILRRNILRRRLAALTGFPASLPRSREFFVQPSRTILIPTRRFGTPLMVRISRRPLFVMPTPVTVPVVQRQLPVVVDVRNPEIETRPFDPIPRVTDIVVEEDTQDDTDIPRPDIPAPTESVPDSPVPVV